MNLLCFPSLLLLVASTVSAFAAKSPPIQPIKTILVTGANKGQGYALCDRILSEHDDTRVLLCSRDEERGQNAADQLKRELQERDVATCIGDGIDRVEVIPLDVTSDESVATATKCVQDILQSSPEDSQTLYGVVSNAGILWGYPLSELMEVCATGVRRVCDAFLPLLQKDDGRLIVVSSGLGPLMHGYSSEERQNAMMDPACTWDETIQPMIDECLKTHTSTSEEDRPKALEGIGFPGGPFAESAPDFHMYGLSKMFADVYMKTLARAHPKLRINSGDPGLVYTDLILKMPRYEGMSREETNGAQTPHEGVEAAMRLLFDDSAGKGSGSGMFYAMSKDKSELLHSDIDKMPNK